MSRRERFSINFSARREEEKMPAEDIAMAQSEMYRAIDSAEKDFFDLLKEDRGIVLRLDRAEKEKYIKNLSIGLANAVFDFFNEQNIYRDNQLETKKLRDVINSCNLSIRKRAEVFINNCIKNIKSDNFHEKISAIKEEFEQDIFNMIMLEMERTGAGEIDSRLSWNNSGRPVLLEE